MALIVATLLTISVSLDLLAAFGACETRTQYLNAIRVRAGATNNLLLAIALMIFDYLYL